MTFELIKATGSKVTRNNRWSRGTGNEAIGKPDSDQTLPSSDHCFNTHVHVHVLIPYHLLTTNVFVSWRVC